MKGALRVFASLLLLATPAAFAVQAQDMIDEAQSLYERLPDSDGQKLTVGLRLADLMCDAATEITSDTQSSAQKMALAETYQNRSVRLYEIYLPALKGSDAIRVKFQLSKLLYSLGRSEYAQKLWRELVDQKLEPGIRRESSLYLAELLELSAKAQSIEEAEKLYIQALELAEKPNIRSYTLYRLAWAQYRLGRFAPAVSNLEKSLALSQVNDRDQLVKDLILFLSREERPATEQMKVLEKYKNPLGVDELLTQLAAAFHTVDRPKDYVTVLEALNRRRPSLEGLIGLLDARHDFLSADELVQELKNLRAAKAQGIRFLAAEKEGKSLQALHALVILWDGQRRATKAGFAQVFTAGVETQITLFPLAPETQKSVSGWLAAGYEPQFQIIQLAQWIGLTKQLHTPSLELLLRQHRLETARQLKQWEIVALESEALETLTKPEDHRALRYQRAKALFELKKNEAALPLFLALAEEAAVKSDDLRKFSQDLVIDILNADKNYSEIARLTSIWRRRDPAREQEFQTLQEKAQFENAALKQDEASLKQFANFCLAKKLTPKSCDNARSLAIQFHAQETLISILRAQGDEAELARQLEVAALFKESAKILEAREAGQDLLKRLKTALLYELEGDGPSRDRILRGVLADLKRSRRKLTPEQQRLVVETLHDANLIDGSILALNWQEPLRLQLAGEIQELHPTALTEKILLPICEDVGLGWQKLQLSKLKALYEAQQKISFIGKRSQNQFKVRVAALDQLAKRANCVIKKTTPELRRNVSLKVSQAYGELADQIMKTPVPEGLDEATAQEVQAQLQAMAEPFAQLAEQWRQEFSGEEIPRAWNFEISAAPKEKTAKAVFDWAGELAILRQNPFDRSALEKLKAHFENKGARRLAAYVSGRISGLEQE